MCEKPLGFLAPKNAAPFYVRRRAGGERKAYFALADENRKEEEERKYRERREERAEPLADSTTYVRACVVQDFIQCQIRFFVMKAEHGEINF